MEKDKLFDIYEKLYFSEIENKDKLHTRVQTIFSLIVISVTVLTYLAKNISFDSSTCLSRLVTLLTGMSFLIVLYSCYRLQNAFWGNKFRFMPTPKEINDYRIKLIEYEANYIKYCVENDLSYDGKHGPTEKLSEYITSELIASTDWNTKKNEDRSSEIFESTKWFFISLIPSILAVIIFLTFDLDSTSPRKVSTPSYIIIPVDNIRRL